MGSGGPHWGTVKSTFPALGCLSLGTRGKGAHFWHCSYWGRKEGAVSPQAKREVGFTMNVEENI